MQPEQQQRIMGYFIEEAKDHLNTIEQGLLNLQSTIEDQEMVDEVFRAAHSVKGGAAMLGINSIQTTAHRLEDCFKLLRECPIKVDQKLETLFLRVCDALKELLEQLQRPFGLAEEASNSIMSGVEPVFEELNTHLGALLRTASIQMLPEATTTQTIESTSSLREEGILLPQTFEREVLVHLREMLQIFKQKDQPSSRQHLQEICIYLEHLADNHNLTVWLDLLETARLAIANEENSYRTLAKIVIKEIKQSQELASQGLADQIRVSVQLRSLLPPVSSELLTLEQGMNEDQYSSTSSIFNRQLSPSDLSAISLTSSLGYSDTLIQTGTDLENMRDESGKAQDQVQTEINPNVESHIISTPLIPEEITTPTSATSEELDHTSDISNYEQGVTPETAVNSQLGEQNGPEVGIAELNSLADLFEGEAPDLDDTWQEEEIISPTLPEQVGHERYQVGVDSTSDFSDLLTQNYDSQPYSSSFAAQGDDLISLFGEDFSEETPTEGGEQTDDLTLPIDFEFENPQGQEQDFEFFTADSIDTEITIADEGVTQAQPSDWLAMETVLDTNTDLSDLLEDSPATPAFGAATAAGASTSDDLINLFEDSVWQPDSSSNSEQDDLRSLLDESTESAYNNDLDEMHPSFNMLFDEEDLRNSFDSNNLFIDQSTAHHEHGLGGILESPHDQGDEQELSHPTVAGADSLPLGDEEETSDLVASTDISFNWLESEEQEILSLDDNLFADSLEANLGEPAITSVDVETENPETHDTALQSFEALE